MRVVVTGGAGFIGANLARALVEGGTADDVVAVDDLSTGRRSNLEGTAVTLVEADITDLDAMTAAFDGAAAVVHLGARPSVPRSIEEPLRSHHANATGTLVVLEACRAAGVGQVVVASSSSVYGANPVLPKSEDLKASPLSPYAASKLATEAYALAHAHSFGLRVLALRFFNVFGPLQPADHAYAAVIPAFVDAALAGRPLPIDGDGEQTRDFTYVGSVVAVIADAITRGVSFDEPVNLAFGERISLLALIERLEALVGHPLERAHRPPRAGDVRHSQADQSRLRELFPDIEPVPLDDGLRATIDWMRGQ